MSDDALHDSFFETEDGLLMSVEELRSFEGYEHFTDEEAKEYIFTMQQFYMIVYELYRKEKLGSQDHT